jgi:hypothetical protein
MDVSITYDKVAALVGVNIPSLEPQPNFEHIQKLRCHLEQVLQCLPCPQSIQHGWKGMVMARKLYTLLTTVPICLPVYPGDAAVYVCPVLTSKPVNNMPLTCTKQASINLLFKHQKHDFMLMQKMECVCFTALGMNINNAFKVSNIPNKRGWQACASLPS